MKFNIAKTVKLDYLGEGWENCYLKFSAISYGESVEIAKIGVGKTDESNVELGLRSIKLLEDNFIEGKAVDVNGKLIEVKKDDLKDFPPDVIQVVIAALGGEPDPNLSRRSGKSSKQETEN